MLWSENWKTLFAQVAFAVGLIGVPAGAQWVYWIDGAKIQRAKTDGTEIEDILTGLSFPSRLALDLDAGKIYWTDRNIPTILRANLNGSGVEDLEIPGLEIPHSIALDTSAGKVYWTDLRTNKIQRANLDGTDVEDLVLTAADETLGLGLDVPGGKMYWTERDTGSTDRIRRANLDGTGTIETLIDMNMGYIPAIALDLGAGKMYWVDWTNIAKIQRANLDGSNIEPLVWISDGVLAPQAIALDLNANMMYWTESSPGGVHRADLDGSAIEHVVSGLGVPRGIALGPSVCGPGEPDCQPNGMSDECEIATRISEDCNENLVPDECEIAGSTSEDCNSNNIPDECEPDCNQNGIADECDIAGGMQVSCNIIELVPSGSTGAYVIDGNTITIPQGGVQLEFRLMLSGWGSVEGSPELGGFQATMSGASLLGVNADPPNPGVNIALPTEVPCEDDADCADLPVPQVTETGWCGTSTNTCLDSLVGYYIGEVCDDDFITLCRNHDECPGWCMGNPEYIWTEAPCWGGPVLPNAPFNFDVTWMDFLTCYPNGKVDPGDGTKFVVSTLRLVVPDDATGSYTIELDPDSLFTFLTTPYGSLIPDLSVVSGRVTINPLPLRIADAPHDNRKHRYLSVDPNTNGSADMAIKVEIAEMKRCQNDPRRGCLVDLDCRDVCEDEPNTLCPNGPDICPSGACINSGPCVDLTPDPAVAWLVQDPQQITSGCIPSCTDEDWVARLSDTVYSQDWSAHTLIHISDCGIVPGVTYHVYACDPANISVCSEPLAVGTQQTPSGNHLHFGDIAGPPINAGDPYEPPDGFVNVIDVSAWGLTKQNYGTSTPPQLHPTMADLHGPGYGVPANYILGLSDQQAIINHGFTWALPWDDPAGLGGVDPSTCPGRLP